MISLDDPLDPAFAAIVMMLEEVGALLDFLPFWLAWLLDEELFFLLTYLSRRRFRWLNGKTPHQKMAPLSNLTAVWKK